MEKRTKLIVMLMAMVAVLAASSTLAQRNYDPKTVETIEGKVLSIEKTTPAKKRGYGVHLTLQTDKETIAVHLGPAWYIDNQTPKIEANNTITVTGSRVTIDGKPAIIAAQVKKGNEILKLRDENGVPMWRRAGRGNR
ncbi:MAG: DNA-binding protein [Limisphaerales bacterium]